MTKSVDNRQKWIEAGYELFGEVGPEALNVDKLSNLVGLNRSSFYHYFRSIEGFEIALFDHHITQYKSFGKHVQHYATFKEFLIQGDFDHHNALAFQRQLMINQKNSRYKKCLNEAWSYTTNKIFILWHASSLNTLETEIESLHFNALRDFYYVHYGDDDENPNPKEVMLRLHNYFNVKP